MKIRLHNIREFLIRRGWSVDESSGVLFDKYFPPSVLVLEEDYYLEIPKSEGGGFQKYIKGIVDLLADIYHDYATIEDLELLFSKSRSIFSLRVSDLDTESGSIALGRQKAVIDGLSKYLNKP